MPDFATLYARLPRVWGLKNCNGALRYNEAKVAINNARTRLILAEKNGTGCINLVSCRPKLLLSPTFRISNRFGTLDVYSESNTDFTPNSC